MSNITFKEYWKEIESLAENMVSEAMDDNKNNRQAAEDDINDSRLHETIDGHQWVIYYSYNLDVIAHSDNESYYEDNFGGDAIAATLKDGGINKLHTVMAFFAMYADVQDKLSDTFDNYKQVA